MSGVFFLGGGGEHAQKPNFKDLGEKQLHTALRSVQLLAYSLDLF